MDYVKIGQLTPFDERLREAMDKRGLRAIDLINQTGISKQSMSNYMNGRRVPKSDTIHSLAKALNVSESWLMGFDTDSEKKSNADMEYVIEKLDMLDNSKRIIAINAMLGMLDGMLKDDRKEIK